MSYMRLSPQTVLGNEAQLRPAYTSSEAEAFVSEAFKQALLKEVDNGWIFFNSVHQSFVYQAMMLGKRNRDYGNISFLTHLMEVTDQVYNCPELANLTPELRAIIPANHDLEDICKEFGLHYDIVFAPVLSFLTNTPRFDGKNIQAVQTDLFMLRDPPNVEGKDRSALQIERIKDMSETAFYTRFFDKKCTYARDLYNMRTINPETGKPYLTFESCESATTYLKKMAEKCLVVEALPVPEHYKIGWRLLTEEIEAIVIQAFPLARAGIGPLPPQHGISAPLQGLAAD